MTCCALTWSNHMIISVLALVLYTQILIFIQLVKQSCSSKAEKLKHLKGVYYINYMYSPRKFCTELLHAWYTGRCSKLIYNCHKFCNFFLQKHSRCSQMSCMVFPWQQNAGDQRVITICKSLKKAERYQQSWHSTHKVMTGWNWREMKLTLLLRLSNFQQWTVSFMMRSKMYD